jgi:hypothetical protein
MPVFDPQEDFEALPVARASEPTSPAPAVQEDQAVNLPVEDVVAPVQEINQVMDVAAHREAQARLADDANQAVAIWSRSAEKQKGETDQDHQERIKHEFEMAVLAVRRQEAAPPAPPMGVPAGHPISAQTLKEMEAGRKQSEYWAEQQKSRPLPNAKEIQAAGTNTPVFRPGEFMHEKGGVGKNLVTQQIPSR